ncbi:MAG: DUF2243 domain-containing protein [Planctomycetes bacterium]|nr:DUF2243 domain-containing protein [Planctomycetota bacterium]
MVEPARRRLLAAAVLLGVGLGGFFDGILFHQILQLHHMLTTRRPAETLTAVEVNMFWDGMFHAFTWLVTVGGLAALWRALADPDAPRPPRTFVGGMLLGWGLFNVVEGVVDHHVLGLHRVVEGAPHPWWDLGFLASGVALIALGTWLVRADAPRPAPAPTARTPAVAIRR